MPPLLSGPHGVLLRSVAASTSVFFVVLAGAAAGAGLSSWASRPEAWSFGVTLPLRASLAWVGLGAPVLAPAAVLLGAFAAARSLGRSGQRHALSSLGIGPRRQWLLVAPLWLIFAGLGGLWSGWAEPAAWKTSIELREAVASAPLQAVALDDGGVVQRDGDTLRLRTPTVTAEMHSFDVAGLAAGLVRLETQDGSWTARSATFRRRDVAAPRAVTPLARTLGQLAAAPVDEPRPRALLHRRASVPILLLLLSTLGWVLGSRSGEPRATGTGWLVVVCLGAVVGSGRVADQLVGTAPPWLLGWTPALLATVAVLLCGRK